jgi:hypothetical protein
MRVAATVVCALSAVSAVLGTPSWKKATPKGFVTTKGTQFQLDGKPFVRVPLRCGVGGCMAYVR